MPGATGLISFYDLRGYRVHDYIDGQVREVVYESGNSPSSSAIEDSLPVGDPHAMNPQDLRRCCERETREMAKEAGVKYIGVDEDEIDDEEFDDPESPWYGCREIVDEQGGRV